MINFFDVYNMTVQQFRQLSYADRLRVIKGEKVEPPIIQIVTKTKNQTLVRTGGVGWHFKKLTEQIIDKKLDCGCATMATRLDKLGPEKCLEHIDELVESIKANKKAFTWLELAKATLLGTTHIFEWHINPLCPIKSMLLEAIRLAKVS